MDKRLDKAMSKLEDLGRMKELTELLEIIQNKNQATLGYITADEIKRRLDDLLMKSFLEIMANKTSKEEDCPNCNETECPSHPTKMN